MTGIEWLKPAVVIGSFLYALIGVLIFWLCFIVVDKITPYNLWQEIIEKKNVALATYTLVLDNNNTLADITPTLPSGWLATEASPGSRPNVVTMRA